MSEVNFPEGWAQTKVIDIADINPKKIDADPEILSGFIPMSHAPTDFNGALCFDEKPWGGIKKSYTNFKDNDVIVAKVTPCFENGKAAIVSGLPNGIGAGSSEFYVIRPAIKDIATRFLFSIVKSHKFLQEGAANMTGAVGLRRVPRAFVEEFPILLPPIAEQKVIADKLDTLLAQVETTKARLGRIPKILKTFRQSVLAAAVSGKLTEEWREATKAKAWTNEKLGDVIGDISQGWSPKCLNEVTVDDSWGVIKTSSVQKILFVEEENKKLPENLEVRQHLKVEVGDILTTRAGPRSRCGITCYVESISLNLMICDKVYRYRVGPEFGLNKFLVMQLNSSSALEKIETLKTGISESGMNLTQKKFKELPLFWPSLEEQTEIVRRVEELFVFADSIEQKANTALERVNNLTPSILAKAFRGELTADWRAANPDLITGDNSAEALLEKIKAERDAIKKQTKKKAQVKKAKV